MKRAFKYRRNRNPVQKSENEKDNTSFFSSENRSPFFNKPIQTKLAIGQPNDKYEKEADSMADAVVNNSSVSDIQNKEISNIQRESLSTPQDDEEIGTAEQRMEEDKLVQEKLEIQKMQDEDMEENMLNKMESEEEEENLQTKKTGQGTNQASNILTKKLNSKTGRGKPLPKNTLAEMESSFNKDFKDVNVHTDNDAIEMNKELGAQAFTHGEDIYFNSGKYNPESSSGKHLLAHELTHVIQQKKSNKKSQPSLIQRYGGCSSTQDSTIDTDHSRALGWLNSAIANLAVYNGTNPSNVHTALDTHFDGSTSVGFAAWIMTNLIFLRSVAWMAGYKCETSGGSSWACTSPTTLATTFWCVPLVDIRLCSLYFTKNRTTRITTLIHEWVHKYGCNFDLGYEDNPEYSGKGTISQLFNADSFANFVRDAH